MRNADVENLGARVIKQGLLCSLSAFPPFIIPGTRQTGLTGRFQKSFDMNNWHSLRKGEKLWRKRKREKDSRINDWREKRVHFSSEGCCENVRVQSSREKVGWKDSSKSKDANYFCQRRIILGHPCVPRVRLTRLAIITKAWERGGGAGKGGGGRGADTRRKGLMQDFM